MNMNLMIPWGYGTTYKTLAEVKAILEEQQYHPNYVRVLIPWLHSKNGEVGVGGARREIGQQPSKPGFAPEGMSFHQPQTYNDGWYGPSAVDLVAKDGPDTNFNHDGMRWDMVPAQYSDLSKLWGVHCNISTEPWHMQGINIDGWQSWVNNGRPVPVAANFPVPGEVSPGIPGTFKVYTVKPGEGWLRVINALDTTAEELDRTGVITRGGKVVRTAPVGSFVLWPYDVVSVGKQVAEKTYRNTAPPKPTLRLGDSGTDVYDLQVVLRIQADGQFGPKTEEAVKAVQRNSGVTVDGIYGPVTDAALRKYLASVGLPH